MKTLFLSPFPPQNAGGRGGGGVGGVSRLRFPPGPPLRSSRFSRHPRLRQAPTIERFWGKAPDAWWPGPQALGARAPSPLETWPTGPWGLDPATLTGLKTLNIQAELYSPMKRRVPLRSSISAAAPGPTKNLANKPLRPASRRQEFQKCPGAHRLMKSLACCTD